MIVRVYSCSQACAKEYMAEWEDDTIQWDITIRPANNGNVTHALKCPHNPLNQPKPEKKKTEGLGVGKYALNLDL